MERIIQCLIHTRAELHKKHGVISEKDEWNFWDAGESRCPHCLDVPEEEWEVICDCLLYRAHMNTPITEVWKGKNERQDD
jgi:hypothetical protein